MKQLIILLIALVPRGTFGQDSTVVVYEGKKYVYHFNMRQPNMNRSGERMKYNATVTVYSDGGALECPAIPTIYWFDKNPAIERGHVNRRNPNRTRTGIKGLKRN